ncbi:MAG: 3-demethylubiquinone-9 3-methyltransferase [uncultured bacterium (gcode 4)]|uniref:3-demethylubiquinone-9 3-methyltransferase n=1 Tax=uncultured bacterium (gcode 4) TaxID=1234023 RepID=K2GGS1_9BACT|nr:MAG: 3-demethylubiquinone-9 3-methyltransferase [uncultured bacterium (gcode 4)]
MKTNEKGQKIVPFLWFDDRAEEAVNLYTSIFNDSGIIDTTHYNREWSRVAWRPEWSVMSIEFKIWWVEFTALNWGPDFQFTPAISYYVGCETAEELDGLWGKLSEGWKILMDLDSYPFSKRYWWTQDRFGVSWQLNLVNENQKITPMLMFVGDVFWKAEEAMKFYTSIFKDSEIKDVYLYWEGEGDVEWKVKHASFILDSFEFKAMESSLDHKFNFSLANSFVVNCETQEEIDDKWGKLTQGGWEPWECGWLKDKYWVSWQVVPPKLDMILDDEDEERWNRVMAAMLKMSKIDIATLRQAYKNE